MSTSFSIAFIGVQPTFSCNKAEDDFFLSGFSTVFGNGVSRLFLLILDSEGC